MVDSSFSIRQEMFNGTHYGKKMARLAIAGFSANVGNVRYTDHSIEQTPSAGMADEKPVEISQPTVASSAKGDNGLSIDRICCIRKTGRWLDIRT